MKKLLLSILLVCSLALPARANFPFHGFFTTPWGTDKQQILNDTKGTERDGHVVASVVRDSGVRISFFYEFDKAGGLQRVITFARPAGSPDDKAMLEFCSTAGGNFEEKYGTYDLAEINILGGPLLIWANEDTEVHMMCDFIHKTFVTMVQKSSLPRVLVLPNQKKSQTL